MTVCQRVLLNQQLSRVKLLEQYIDALSGMLQQCLESHRDAVARLCQIPGIAVCAAEQIIAEIGPEAKAFSSDR